MRTPHGRTPRDSAGGRRRRRGVPASGRRATRATLPLAWLAALLLACGGHTGWRIRWSSDGTLDPERTGMYEAGRRIVPEDDRLLFPNGRRGATGVYRHGRPDGYWIYWHENGQRAAEGLWVGGAREGSWTHWHPSGERSCEGAFEDGRKTGFWTYWREDGGLDTRRSGEYEDGRRVRR